MDEKIVWVGPRESDILYSNIDFYRSVTYNGTNTDRNISLTSETGIRIDHISTHKKWGLIPFLKRELYPLLNDSSVKLLFYNPLQSYLIGDQVPKNTLCLNDHDILDYFRNKANMRTFAQDCIPVVPYVHFTGAEVPQVSFDIGEKDVFALQKVYSSSGRGTYCFPADRCSQYVNTQPQTESYILSPFLKNACPINVHVVIFKDGCLILPPSYQLISRQGEFFSYVGGDFHTDFSSEVYSLILRRTASFAEKLRAIGYRGVCGIDYMLTKHELYFLEVNTRFQASSFLMNKLLAKEKKASLQQLSLQAFRGESQPFESFMQFHEAEGFFTVTGDYLPQWYQTMTSQKPPVISSVIRDGVEPGMTLTENAYLFRVVVSRNICWRDEDFQLQAAPNTVQDSAAWRNKVLHMDPLSLKIGLLNQGVRFSAAAEAAAMQQGMIRQGVFQSVDLTLPNGLIINAPYHTDFSELSPYSVQWNEEAFLLYYENRILCPVAFDARDPYRENTASRGTLFGHAAFWATDRLRVHHQFRCNYKHEGMGCRFCNVKEKKGVYFLDDVSEIIDFYLKHTDFRHFLIGGGSGSDMDESKNIITLAKHIRTRSDKTIYAMCLPPKDLSVLSKYRQAGIDEIGFNLELFDREIAKRVMPGKGNIPLSQYESAYREAVRLWGRCGMVRSLMVLGLEPLDSFYRGIEWLCKLGVMPIISVFRPVKNIELNEALPPSNMALFDIFYRATEIAKRYGLSLGPSCSACQNNTLSLPEAFLLNVTTAS